MYMYVYVKLTQRAESEIAIILLSQLSLDVKAIIKSPLESISINFRSCE